MNSLALSQQASRQIFRTLFNQQAWAEIVDFLIAQDLARLGLRRVARREGPACGRGPLREALPVGNTGITINLPNPIES